MIRTTVLTIGERKNKPRLWIEGKYLERAGFIQGCTIFVDWKENSINITTDEKGDHIVSKKKDHSVIDINNEKIKSVFKVADKVRVLVDVGKIIIQQTKQTIRKSQQLNDKSCGSLFAGGGLLDEAVKQAGYNTIWAIEKEQNYAEVWQANHNGIMHNCDISDIPYDELAKVELLVGGIPCEPFSQLRQNQKGEFHENTDLSMFFLMIVEAVNPKTIILEEVAPYLNSEIGQATIQALKRMGYNVETKIISGLDHGEFTVRKRAVIIASTEKINFPEDSTQKRTMSEILLSHDDPSCEWWDRSTKAWVFDHWDKQTAKGNNFASQQITADSDNVQAITKRYFAQQGGNPVVKHPFKEGTFRWLTPKEVSRIMGLPDDYYLGSTKTNAGEILGQGVLVKVFKKVIQSMGVIS